MKKLTAALMCGAMTMSLFATAQAGETGSEQKDAAQEAIDARKEEAEKTGEYQKIIISFFDWTGAPAGIDRINEALSEHTRETLGVDVELMIIDSAAYSEDMKLMLSSGEQVDIFSTCGPGYMTCVNNGYTLDLEEYDLFQTYGVGIQEKVRAEYLDACRVGGVLYGAPPIKDYAIQTSAVCIGQEYLDAIGYDYDAAEKDDLGYAKVDWDEINKIFAQIHEAFPDKYVMAIQDNELTQGSTVDNIGGDYYGTLLDPVNSLKIENVYESDIFKEWCERAYEWNQNGYLSKDAMTDKTGASAKVKSGGSYSAVPPQVSPHNTQDYPALQHDPLQL